MLKHLLIITAFIMSNGILFGQQGVNLGNVKKTPAPVNVDGIEGGFWKQVDGFPFDDGIVFHPNVIVPTASGTAKLLYDNDNLYIMLIVVDDTIVKDSEYGITHGKDDGFDIPIGFGNHNSQDYAADASSFVRLDIGMDIDSTRPTLAGSQGNYFGKVTESNIVAAIKKTDEGANIELMIPWSEIGLPSGGLTGNDIMLFDARYNDDDGNYEDPDWPGTTLREAQMTCGSKKPVGVNWWWETPYYCSTVTLVDETIATTGLEDKILDKLSIYPNPASEFIKLNNIPIGARVQVFNLIGQNVINILAKNTDEKLNVEMLKQGIYFVNVDGYATERIMVK